MPESSRRSFLATASAAVLSAQESPFLRGELIIPPERWHNHASTIVELPNGDLFVCWYHGSGERTADDVIVEAARRPRGSNAWSPRYTIADTPGFPDTNPTMFVDSQRRLWLLWPVILANEWHTALMKYRISSNYAADPPRWDVNEVMLFIPRNFEARVKQVATHGTPHEKTLLEHAADKYFTRMGWMTRVHPLELPTGRVLVPLYSDGFSFSLVAITDDGGKTWSTSEPLVGPGNIQPSIVRQRDGTLVAYMRDNGPPPKRIQMSSSKDDGVTWGPVVDTDLPNPGAGIEAIVLRDGKWVLIYNDTERSRNSLAVSLSDDEGKTWKWTRHLEKGAGSYHYPSILQARDGTLHASYSFYEKEGQSIKHAHFNVAWIMG